MTADTFVILLIIAGSASRQQLVDQTMLTECRTYTSAITINPPLHHRHHESIGGFIIIDDASALV